ncbi:MAG: sigma-54-dependent Fis family transcriptional regulator [Nitrospirae bacterium]|nr:sigma-54-dependent Fis family transcriptional regulator [Nitrospirota bacterium]
MKDKSLGVLIVDDDQSIRDLLGTILKEKYTVVTASSGKAALKILKEVDINIVLLDMRLPDIEGLDILKTVKEDYPDIEVMVVSVVKDIEMVVRAMRLGAFNYISKDFDSDEVLAQVDKMKEKIEEKREKNYLRGELEQVSDVEFIRGQSVLMSQLEETLEKIAPLPTTVLLLGESGTGKKLIAKYLHSKSHLSDKPFVTVDLSTIPENLIESTLFGHEKGAFTGAHKQNYGKFELANGGTLFLDEIGCLKYETQSKLLRVIQDKEIERVGSSKTIKVDVRLVVATNIDLTDAVRKGEFREDLYYRINVVPIKLPPLRERRQDIPEFVKNFMVKYNRRFRKNVNKITDQAMNILLTFNWPGNIRELENLIERLVAVSDNNVIAEEDIPVDYYMFPKSGKDGQDSLLQNVCDTFERNFILKTLEHERWSRTKTANILGVPISTLKYKFNRLNIYDILGQRKKLSRRSKNIAKYFKN